jgi:hypothetical protein
VSKIRFVNDFTYNPVGEDVDALAIALNRPVKYVDDDGFSVELQTGAIHPKKGWLVWIDYYEKKPEKGWTDCNYYLRVQINGQIAMDWTVETYNPYFGCHVAYIAWHEEVLVLIYTEKHCCYGASLSLKEATKRVELGHLAVELCVRGDDAFIYDRHNLKRYKLPTWEELPSPTIQEGIELGILEEVI